MKCTKVYFADEKQALFYIDKLKKTSVRDKTPQQAYLCPKCFNWHLTSQPPLENKQAIYMQRQIDNLKAKLLHTEKERDVLKDKLAKHESKNERIDKWNKKYNTNQNPKNNE